MKVIVAGFPKTGTKSMNWALSALGYKVYDYPENVYLLQKEYKKIFNDGWCTEDFRKMYENVDAVVDTPAFFFWEELAKAFPDAKIILTMRDSDEEWLQSMKNLVAVAEGNIMIRLLEILSPTQRKANQDVIEPMGMATMAWQAQSAFSRKFHMNDEMLKLKYRAHNAYVLQGLQKPTWCSSTDSYGGKARAVDILYLESSANDLLNPTYLCLDPKSFGK